MKVKKFMILTLALACAFIAKPSYANEGDQNNVPLTNHLEKSTEDLMEEKQNLKKLIEETNAYFCFSVIKS